MRMVSAAAPVAVLSLLALAAASVARAQGGTHDDGAAVEMFALPPPGGEGVQVPLRVPAPPRPLVCLDVPEGTPLQAALDASAPGAALCLAPGTYAGPVSITLRRSVWGPREAIIRSTGGGTTVRLEGEDTALLGVTVDGSGHRFDMLDAAVHVTGFAPRVEGVAVKNATFGVLVEKARRASIRGNTVNGDNRSALGLRGDSIRLWETYESLVEGNLVEHGRDLVVWYSSDNVVRGNLVRDARYGTHLMYSHRNVIEDNVYLHTVVGIFLMYSRDVFVRRNTAAGAAGAAGMGLGLKESGNLVVVVNVFVRDTIGVYIDNSPMQQNEHNWFRGNHFRLGESAVVFLSSTHRNHFSDNAFRDNLTSVRVEGGGDALDVTWERNDFDEYAGYDFDHDGFGDVPFELRSLGNDLISKTPELQLFRGSPALALLNAASELVPLFTPKTLLRDLSPRLVPLPLPPHVELLRAD